MGYVYQSTNQTADDIQRNQSEVVSVRYGEITVISSDQSITLISSLSIPGNLDLSTVSVFLQLF